MALFFSSSCLVERKRHLCEIFPNDIVPIIKRYLFLCYETSLHNFQSFQIDPTWYIEAVHVDSEFSIGITVDKQYSRKDTDEDTVVTEPQPPPPPPPPQPPLREEPFTEEEMADIEAFFHCRPVSYRYLQFFDCSSSCFCFKGEMNLDIDDWTRELQPDTVWIQAASIGCYPHETIRPYANVGGDTFSPPRSRIKGLHAVWDRKYGVRVWYQGVCILNKTTRARNVYATLEFLYLEMVSKLVQIPFNSTTRIAWSERKRFVLPDAYEISLQHIVKDQYIPMWLKGKKRPSVLYFWDFHTNEIHETNISIPNRKLFGSNDNLLVIGDAKNKMSILTFA